MSIEHLREYNILLSPKNNITEFYKQYLETENIFIKGFIDNHKSGDDIIPRESITNKDIIIVYSPNHWKEITQTLPQNNLFILYNKNQSLVFTPFSSFKGYDSSFTIDVNTHFTQKVFWANHLMEHINNNKNLETYGYSWGNPESSKDPLGNYLAINTLLSNLIKEDSTILELGTLAGKWTKYLLKAQKVICVDVNSYFIDIIKQRYTSELQKIEFYVSKGNELQGIKNKSIDVLFCIDTLVRVEKQYIFDYLKEIARTLKKDGKAIVHLPNSDIQDCKNRNFISLSTNEIKQEANKYFQHYSLDSSTLVHGTLLKINIKE